MLKTFFHSVDKRSQLIKKNIIFSFGIKGLDMLFYFLLVPVTLGFLNPYEYGIWLTLNSMLMWINSFDIGLGNGLRNKLTSAIAQNNIKLARTYVSTTFFMLIGISIIIIIIGSAILPITNWFSILGTTPVKTPKLNEVIYLSFCIFSINFIFKFIGNVYQAFQLPAISNLLITLGHGLALLLIYIVSLITTGHLIIVAIIYTSAPLLVYLIAYPITFCKIYPQIAPSIRLFNRKKLRDLMSISVNFFFLQIAGVLLFAFSNILISNLFGPEDVTPYNIAFRYFSVIQLFANLIIAPLWSASTDAFEKKDFSWIHRCMKKVRKLIIYSAFILLFMVISSKLVYKLWIGNTIEIPYMLSLTMAIYIFVVIFSLSYSNILNGMGKLKIQSINTTIMAILFFPICKILGGVYGVTGICIGMTILNIPGAILNYIQYNKVINHKDNGIWSK